jgi:ABC-type multidrug transport system ATPase subunit
MIHTLMAENIRLRLGQRQILSNVNIECRTGQITGLLGRNGAGKTSLMRIIYGDLSCECQSVTIDNIPSRRSYTQPDRIRYMPQFNFIPGFLTLERVCKDFELDFRRLAESFSEFQSLHRMRISELSTGQRRLVNIYMISRSHSQFVMLDEPFTLLSPIQIEKVRTILEEEKQNKGILITDHLHQPIWDISDQVYTLAAGKTCPTHRPVPSSSSGTL